LNGAARWKSSLLFGRQEVSFVSARLDTQMIASDQVFADTVIYLDGSSFQRCKFERCTIAINGFLGCTLVDPQFIDCHWQVSGPAQTTFDWMTALYRAGAVDLIEGTFNQIRGERPS
jgi:hypothetical protein